METNYDGTAHTTSGTPQRRAPSEGNSGWGRVYFLDLLVPRRGQPDPTRYRPGRPFGDEPRADARENVVNSGVQPLQPTARCPQSLSGNPLGGNWSGIYR